MFTDPAKLRELGFCQGPAQLISGKRKMKRGKNVRLVKNGVSKGISCTMLASDRVRVVSEPNHKGAFLCHMHFALVIFNVPCKVQLDIHPLRASLYWPRLQKDTDNVLTLG